MSLAFSGLLLLAAGGLLILTAAFTPFIIPVIGSFGPYDLGSMSNYNLIISTVM